MDITKYEKHEEAAELLLNKLLPPNLMLKRDKEVTVFKAINLPRYSTNTRPGLAIYTTSKIPIGFIEVDSGSYINTIKKLSLVLLLHVMYLRITSSCTYSHVKGLVIK